MSQSRLFDYNSSFSVIRTNPKLTGNFKISVDSEGGVWFNSMDVNNTLSNDAFKKYNVTGENSYASDVSAFFSNGKISNDIIFQVGEFTNGENEPAQYFSDQYDFFYASGASALIDKNYPEDFSYFAPLWIKNEIPDFFVIFKLDNPMDYPYSANVTQIDPAKRYKVIADYDTPTEFKIAYGKDASGSDLYYYDGEIFQGNTNNSTYTIISGTGKVAVYAELENLPLVNDVASTFKNKILNNATAIKTFDLRENTKIGKYIRSIFNNKQFSNSPLEVSWGYNAYTYYKGVSVSEGIYTRKGELLNQYLSSAKSDPMIDLEDYITSGFSRNGIICPNLLNLEFFFDDDDSDLYTINRYVGMYVSRNDIASIRTNGKFFYEYRNLQGNENTPIPSRDNVGYYYNNNPYEIGATSGIRLFYENATGFLPGSDNVNLLDPNKLFYLTDKNENFYSLKRTEEYGGYGGSEPKYSYGPFDYTTGQFSATGSTGATSGSLVIQNQTIDLLNFTGSDAKLVTVKGELPAEAGKAYAEIEFLNSYNENLPLTLKLYWPNGSRKDGSRRYDLISSADFSSMMIWTGGSYYSTGNSYYFNASGSTTSGSQLQDVSEIALALSSVLYDVDTSTMDYAQQNGSSIIRVKNPGLYGNDSYSISIFDDYSGFSKKYRGSWDNTTAYSVDDIVLYNNTYYSTSSWSGPTGGNQFTTSPDSSTNWTEYSTFSYPGYVKINGTDASELKSNVSFIGGTVNKNNRIIFDSKYSNQVLPGNYIKTESGFSMIDSVNKYVDDPVLDQVTRKVIGFNDFEYKLVLNLQDIYAQINLGSDKSFNVYDSASLNLGVFTFFDTKEFNFDFWSSDYSYAPTPETYKYFQISPDTDNVIEPNIPYFVKRGQINYAGSIYNEGNLFYGATGYTSFKISDPSLNLSSSIAAINNLEDRTFSSGNVVVFPAQYSDVLYNSSLTSYTNIGYTRDLEAFNGFIGIQGILLDPKNVNPTKEEVFYYGKLNSEYEYLKENYTVRRANISRIVPYINKWGSSLGTDARGNRYRLNSSPAFSPTNFSPSFDRITPDPKYLTHEWFLLEQPPRYFPKEFMNNQNSYLPYKIDLDRARSADPEDALYLSSYFTVEPSDYTEEFSDTSFYTKELFTPLVYSEASGYYETIFRGCKIVLKKRSDTDFDGSVESDRYVKNFRGYEDYKFSAILRAVREDDTVIQAPVKYQVIENDQQKFILFVCDVVVRDQKSFNLGYSGSVITVPGTKAKIVIKFDDYVSLGYSTANAGISVTTPLGNLTFVVPSGTYYHEYADEFMDFEVIPILLASGFNVNYDFYSMASGFNAIVEIEAAVIGSQYSFTTNTPTNVEVISVTPGSNNQTDEEDPVLDYTLLYTLNDKERLRSPLVSSQKFYLIDDIKLSAALDLSLASGSVVNTTRPIGIINSIKNPEYDTDFREEIHLTYVPNADGATGGPSSTGAGSFILPPSLLNSTYPWPTGVGPGFIEFGKVSGPTGSSYLFNIPFSVSNPVTVPVGPSSVYKEKPVIQKSGGSDYYKGLLSRCSVSYISDKFNNSSQYIKYTSYEWDEISSSTISTDNGFELYFERPTKITKPSGSLVIRDFNGPQTLRGARVETGYSIIAPDPARPSILTRYSGEYEPIFRKVIHFDRDKTDTLVGSNSIDLSFRNCNFAPDKEYFGISRNLGYTKVSEGSNILAAASSYPEGPVYPLIGLTPIARKNFNIFSSSWDPGYYDRYLNTNSGSPVAGTRGMKEYKTFFGSKVMQTPDPIQANNYITLEISRTSGNRNVKILNSSIDGYIKSIQEITKANSGTGIGSVGPYLSGVDYDKLDLKIFSNAEVIWQNFPDQNRIKGIIRVDRILRRYLLNSGIKKVFINNMISQFGVGDPLSINDDINTYIDLNVAPIYRGDLFDLYVKKTSSTTIPTSEIVRGDLFSSDRYKLEYFIDNNYKLTPITDLIYEFEYSTEVGFYYSLMFNIRIAKI
jgi:hypothetical protein